MKRGKTFALVLSCAISITITFTAAVFASCGSDEEKTEENSKFNYDGSWFSEDGAEYYFHDGKHGTYRCGDVGGTFDYTVSVTLIHMHITFWSDTYHTIWKRDIEASYYINKKALNIGGVFFYRKGNLPKKDEAPTDSVESPSAADTVVVN